MFGGPGGRVRRIAVLILVIGALFLFVRWWDFAVPTLNSARYQAVFLSNGQTYFGRFTDRLGPYVKVEDAFYIQQSQPGDEDKPPESKLIRRGNELHQPAPAVLIPKSAILFVEDLRPDSAIAQFMIKENAR